MRLAEYIRRRRGERDLLLMTHIVLGHPDMHTCLELVDVMVRAGVDLIELQIPFSEPLADGPVIASACQQALANGVTVDDCLELAQRVTRRYPIPFLFVSYFNVLCKRGIARFVDDAREAGVAGVIVPDCPLEESDEYVAVMRASSLAPIFLVSPRSSQERLRLLGRAGEGLVYAVARTGVTGASTEFSTDLERYLARVRQATELPLAVGFGLRSPADVRFLVGKADIAVIGSQTLKLLERDVSAAEHGPGLKRVASFLAELGGPAAQLPWRAHIAHLAAAPR
jgi:tryptophan synthase alpha chain